jgi:hypothetical protein
MALEQGAGDKSCQMGVLANIDPNVEGLVGQLWDEFQVRALDTTLGHGLYLLDGSVGVQPFSTSPHGGEEARFRGCGVAKYIREVCRWSSNAY